jgi:hypothetical protein
MSLKRKASATRLTILLLVATILCWPQAQQPGTEIAGEMIRLGMSKTAVLMALSNCCKPVPLGETELIVPARDISSGVLFGGKVYLERGKVTGIAPDRDWSAERASHDTALAFYDLFRKNGMAGPRVKYAEVKMWAYSVDMKNATAKYLVMQFAEGRSIRFEIVNPIPGTQPEAHQQVVLSECIGSCADW